MPEEFALSPRVSPRGSSSQTVVECGYCNSVMTSPVRLPCCNHYFCRGCWEEIVDYYKGTGPLCCPTCGALVKGNVINVMTDPQERQMRRLVENAPRACIYDGCPWTGRLSDQQDHLAECQCAPQTCRFNGCNMAVPRSQIAEHEANCRWGSRTCPYCRATVPLHEVSQHKAVVLHQCELRGIQERLGRLESQLEKRQESDPTAEQGNGNERTNRTSQLLSIMAVQLREFTREYGEKFDEITAWFHSLGRRLKKVEDDKQLVQDHLPRELRDDVSSLKDESLALYQEMQDKARVSEVYKKAEIDLLMQDLKEEVLRCCSMQQQVAKLESQPKTSRPESPRKTSRPESPRKTSSRVATNASAPEETDGRCRASPAMPGAAAVPAGLCITWSIAEAMQGVARHSDELRFQTFNKVPSSMFTALDLPRLHLAFVRKRGVCPGDVPKSWLYMYAPKGAYLEWTMRMGNEERCFAHEFDAHRSGFGGVFSLPFTRDFDAGDLHEGVLVQTRFEDKDGRRSHASLVACILELHEAETINGASHQVAWVAFPDGAQQVVELHWITCVQKVPSISVVITGARQIRTYGTDISVSSCTSLSPA